MLTVQPLLSWYVLFTDCSPPLTPIGLILPQYSTPVTLLVAPGSSSPLSTTSLYPYWPLTLRAASFFSFIPPCPQADPATRGWRCSVFLEPFAVAVCVSAQRVLGCPKEKPSLGRPVRASRSLGPRGSSNALIPTLPLLTLTLDRAQTPTTDTDISTQRSQCGLFGGVFWFFLVITSYKWPLGWRSSFNKNSLAVLWNALKLGNALFSLYTTSCSDAFCCFGYIHWNLVKIKQFLKLMHYAGAIKSLLSSYTHKSFPHSMFRTDI